MTADEIEVLRALVDAAAGGHDTALAAFAGSLASHDPARRARITALAVHRFTQGMIDLPGLDLRTDPREWERELEEELADAIVYRAMLARRTVLHLIPVGTP